MLAFAPRLSPRLVAELARLEKSGMPIAEPCRRIGDAAERMGLRRPSYERVRTLVHEFRRRRRYGPSTAAVAWEVAVRARPPEHILDHVSGIGVRPLS